MKRLVAFLLALVLAAPTYALAAGTTKYTVTLGNPNDGKSADVYVFISGEKDGKTGGTTYNAFQFTFLYDAEKLTFNRAEDKTTGQNRQFKYKDSNGMLVVSGCGEDVSCDVVPVVIHFTTNHTGTTQIRLVEALVSERSSVKADAAVATIPNTETCKNGVLTITTGSFGVTLPSGLGLFGDISVVSGGTYTFRGSPYYDYDLAATMGGNSVDIIDSHDGTFSIKDVTGALEISGSRTPKNYSVTVTGSGKNDVTAPLTATYVSSYTFSINKKDLADYAVTATVDGRAVSVTEKGNNSYTISGDQITGDVTITVSKAAQSGTTLVIFSGSGVEIVDCEHEYSAKSDGDLRVPVKELDPNYDYCITVNGEQLEIDEYFIFTIPKKHFTGSILAVTVTKTAKINMTVEVYNYSPLSGNQRAYLITAKNNGAAQAGQGFAYDGMTMLYSPKYEAFALVITAGSAPNQETVKSKLTVSTEPYTTVAYNGDVNTTGRVDVNDAQLAYDMFLGQYSLNELDQMMWLRADSNGDKTLDVQDVQTVLQAIA